MPTTTYNNNESGTIPELNYIQVLLYEICRRPEPMGLLLVRSLPSSVPPGIRNHVVLITSKALYQRAS